MMAMSTMDILYSVFTLGSPLTADDFANSCQAFGFLGQGARLSSVLYNGCLALYYLMTIRYGWKDSNFRKSLQGPRLFGLVISLEHCLHLLPMVLGWSLAVPPLFLDLYNPRVLGCTIARPKGPFFNMLHLKIYQFVFFYMWVWIVFGFMLVAMTLMDRSISTTEKRSAAFQIDTAIESRRSSLMETTAASTTNWQPMVTEVTIASAATTTTTTTTSNSRNYPTYDWLQQQGNNNSSSRRLVVPQVKWNRRRAIAAQAMLYCSAFFLTLVWSTTQVFVVVWMAQKKPWLPLIYAAAIFETSVGFWNALIYIRPRYLAYRRKQRQQQQQQTLRLHRVQLQQQQQQPQQAASTTALGEQAQVVVHHANLDNRMEAFFHATSLAEVANIEEKSQEEDIEGDFASEKFDNSEKHTWDDHDDGIVSGENSFNNLVDHDQSQGTKKLTVHPLESASRTLN